MSHNISQSSIYMPAFYYIQKKHLNFARQASGCLLMGGNLACWQLFDHVWGSWSNALTLCACHKYSSFFHRTFLSYIHIETYLLCLSNSHVYSWEHVCMWVFMHLPTLDLTCRELSGKTRNLMPRFPNFHFS